MTSIENNAFGYCYGLKRIIVGSSVTSIAGEAFNDCRLESVYIPSSVTTISASNYFNSPFLYCSSSLVIYTDVANASSKPSGWGTYWNYYSSSGTLTVNYGYTVEQYKSAVGLAFATSSEREEAEGTEVEILGKDVSYQINSFYLQDITFNKKETILLTKKQVKIKQ